jgi:hypothetical protein
MAVQSIRTPIEERDVAGNHLLVPTRQVPFGEMDGVGKLNHLPEKIWSRAKAFDAGHLLSSRARAPKIVCRGDFAGGFGIFGDLNLCRRFCMKFGGLRFVIHVHDCEL